MDTQLLLPYVVDAKRIIPNDLIRSSLFTISNHNQKREYFSDKMLFTFGQTEINYRGEELRQDDQDVWMQLIFLASKSQNASVEFMPYRFMSEIGWPGRTQYRDKLKECLERMTATKLGIKNKEHKAGLAISLVRKFLWRDETGEATKKWTVWLEPEVVKLFENQNYSKLEWEQRKKLTPLAKWLHSYYTSHHEPYPVSVPTLMKACGSKTKTLKHFKMMLKDALVDLVQVRLLREYFIDAKNILHVKKHHRVVLNPGSKIHVF